MVCIWSHALVALAGTGTETRAVAEMRTGTGTRTGSWRVDEDKEAQETAQEL